MGDTTPPSRVVVATLEEAADYVEQVIAEHDSDVMPAIHAPDLERGATVGPLPDGTVIEIAAMSVPSDGG